MKKFFVWALLTCLSIATILCAMPYQAAFAEGKNDLHYSEMPLSFEESVAKYLGIGNYSYEELTGFSEECSYLLAEGEKCYLIYDSRLNRVAEYSTSTNSAFLELSSDTEKVYLAPSCYFFKQEGCYFDVEHHQPVSSEDLEEFVNFERNLAEAAREESNIVPEETLNTWNPSAMPSLMFNYYSKLCNNMADNMDNSPYPGCCGIVAAGMLLSFYDSVYNDNVIDDSSSVVNFEVPVTKAFSSYSSISVNSYTESPGVGTGYQDYLVNVARSLNIFNSSTTVYEMNMGQIRQVVEACINARNIGATVYYIQNPNDSFLTTCLSHGPMIAGIEITAQYGHVAVAYDYNNPLVTTNFGYRGDGTMCEYTIHRGYIKQGVYVIFSDDHVCSNNYQWSYNGCTGYVCPCGEVVCNHENGTLIQQTNTTHKLRCLGCNTTVSEPHTFYNSDDNAFCTRCGYSVIHTHSYVYTPLNRRKHTKSCATSWCTYSVTESCQAETFFGDPNPHCAFCGQTLGALILGDLSEQEEITSSLLSALACGVVENYI